MLTCLEVQDRESRAGLWGMKTIRTIYKTNFGSLWSSVTVQNCMLADALISSRVMWAVHTGMVRIVVSRYNRSWLDST